MEDSSYLEFNFSISPLEPAREILIAELGELGFESFVENENGLLAYILPSNWSETLFKRVFVLQNPSFKIEWTVKEIEQQNWNEVWESNFEPIEINDLCRVCAPFHERKNIPYEIKGNPDFLWSFEIS